MYGTIARLRVRPGAETRLQALLDEYERIRVPGSRGGIAYRSDRDPNEVWLAVVFDSREAYQANAGSAEQHQRYTQLRELLEADPEWHDGEIIRSSL